MEVPSHRACAHCRSQKVRCIPEDGNPDVCQRCARSGRSCVFTPLQKRKQRKRTDTRVAELEREMRAMRAVLKKKQESGPSASGEESGSPIMQAGSAGTGKAQGLWYHDPSGENSAKNSSGFWTQQESGPGGESDASTVALQKASTSVGEALWPLQFPDNPKVEEADVVDRGILSMASARSLFDIYRKELYPHYPMVYIEESMTADEFRRTKPTLFLAVIAAAAMKENPDISTTLDREILQAYAKRSLVNSEKSVELVQALLVSAVWYHPPNKFGQLKYYEYIHMAATMAMDIHIGEWPSSKRKNFDNYAKPAAVHPAEDVANPDLSMSLRNQGEQEPETATVEARRTFLACFAICAGVSLSLRRPNMLRYTSYTRDCMEYMERSPNTVPGDRTFVAWCRLMVISEEISTGLSYDDPGGMARIEELKTQMLMKDFDRKLLAWERSVPDADFNASLRVMYYTVRISLNEVALHIDHNPEDFKAPYQMGPVVTRRTPFDDSEMPTQPLVDAVSDCITSAHRLIDAFLHIDAEAARSLPVFTYVRVSLAAFVLAKLCLSAVHPESRINKVLDRSSLKAEQYMDRAILYVRDIIGPKRCRVPAIFLALVFKLRQWCTHPELIDRYNESGASQIVYSRDDGGLEGHYGRGMYVHDNLHMPGPRVIERGSSVDDSPATREGQSGSVSSPSTSTSPPASLHNPHAFRGQNFENSSATQEANPLPTQRISSVSPSQQGSDFTATTAATAPNISGVQQSTGLTPMPNGWMLPGNTPMELDGNFFNYFPDPATFPEGGLTGLDDWGGLQMGQDGVGDISGLGPMPAWAPGGSVMPSFTNTPNSGGSQA